MNLHTDTINIQSEMAAYCRTGAEVNLPGANSKRFAQYRRLVRGVVHDALETTFPITRDYLDTGLWNRLADDFLANHKCQSWQVWNIAGEFYEYSLDKKTPENLGLPVLKDLLQFEWAETELYNMKNKDIPAHSMVGDIALDVPVFNPEFKIFRFDYPIHTMRPEMALEKKGEYFLLMFRDLDDGRIHFLDISPWHVWMIEQMTVYAMTLEQTLVKAQSLFETFDDEKFRKESLQFLKHLQQKKFLLGFKKLSYKN